MHLIKFLSVLMLAFVSRAAFAAEPANDHTLEGVYSLQGATDVGSQLQLGSKGRFKWVMMYGNQDLAAAGTWEVKDKHVVLTSTPNERLAFRGFTDDEYNIVKKPKAGVWVAIVGVPRVGPVSDVDVKFVAKSGKTASALTDRNGDAIVSMPPAEEWTRVGLKRANDPGDYQWLDVPKKRSTGRLTSFAITNPIAIQGPAFRSLTLSREKDGLAIVTDGGGMSGTYVKHSQ